MNLRFLSSHKVILRLDYESSKQFTSGKLKNCAQLITHHGTFDYKINKRIKEIDRHFSSNNKITTSVPRPMVVTGL